MPRVLALRPDSGGVRELRIKCKLFGCIDNGHGDCDRCGAWIYDSFITVDMSLLMPMVFRLERAWVSIAGAKCSECGKRYWLERHRPCCSPECFDKWIPF